MSDLFANVPLDEGTKIISEKRDSLDGIPVLVQSWSWDGVYALSMIFVSADVSGKNDQELEAWVRKSPLVNAGSKITISKGKSGYTFVNFNFETPY